MRLFVAIEIPSEVRLELERSTRSLRQGLPRARWLKPEAMHLTLVFLGETDEARLDDLHRELASACVIHAPLRLQLTGVGAFPPRGRRRVVWVGVETEGDLGYLQAEVAGAVERVTGIEPDRRPYHPHLTLARCKPPWPAAAVERLATDLGSRPSTSFDVDQVSLVSSELHRSGPRYRTVVTFPLQASS